MLFKLDFGVFDHLSDYHSYDGQLSLVDVIKAKQSEDSVMIYSESFVIKRIVEVV